MMKKNWKNVLALALALAIVLGTGVLNSANWLHAGETQEQTAPAVVEPTPVQGETVTQPLSVPDPTEAPEQVTEQIVPTQPAEEPKPTEEPKPSEEPKPTEESKPSEETKPTEETKPSEETKPTEQTQPTEESKPTEETQPTEESKQETQPEVLPAAQLPIVVKQVDAQGQSLGQWETTLTFAEGETTAHLTLPQIEGYTAPELTVERTAETTALEVEAVYQPVEKTPEQLLQEALDPNRSVKVTYTAPADGIYYGDKVTLKAEIVGYGNVDYTLQWRWSTDNENWTNVKDATSDTLEVLVDETNADYYWNILLTVTGIKQA